MNVQEKARRWAAFATACPFLTINPRGLSRLSYKGEELLDYTENLFYNRAFYGPFHIGGASPFYSLTIRPNGQWSTGPHITFETDRAVLCCQTLEDLHHHSLKFFRALKSDTATRIKALAWPPKSIIDFRMWIGATLYLRGKPLPDWVTKIDRVIASFQTKYRCLQQRVKGGAQ
jgi:hypothetical protein